VRAALCRNLSWLGVELDEQASAARKPRISRFGSAGSVWVIPTNEELMIAQHTLALVKPSLSACGQSRSSDGSSNRITQCA
jgi:acetate kinase